MATLLEATDSILEHLPASIARSNRQFRLTFANARLARFLGKELHELLGKTCTQLGMTNDVWGDWYPTLQKVFDTSKPGRFEFVSTTHDAVDRLVQIWVEPEHGPDGSVTSALCLAVTNNKVKDLRVALQTQTDLFTAFMDNGLIFAWMRNAVGRYVYANASYLSRFGYTSEKLYGTNVADRWPPDIAAAFLANDEKVLNSGKPLQVYETAPELDGTTRTWLNIKFPFQTPDGNRYIGGIGVDVTERLRMEEDRRLLERKLQEAQKLESLALMAGGVANDFNNLLTAILGNVSLARMNPTNIEQNLHKIEAAALRAADLCKQLLNFSGQGQLNLSEVDLNTYLGDSITGWQALLNESVRFSFRPSTGPVIVNGDPGQLRQAITKLIEYASESLGTQGGTISLSIGTQHLNHDFLLQHNLGKQLVPGMHALVEIADTGPGLDTTEAERIFDPFFPIKGSAAGLGLAAVQGIVHGHDGGIIVETAAGEGTKFKILLPLSGSSHQQQRSVARANFGRGRTVLVIDDDAEVRAVARSCLMQAGFFVAEAPDGLEGVKAFQKYIEQIDIVLLDFTMPRMNGLGAFRELQRLKPDIKVVLTSGFAAKEALLGFSRNDLAGFLHKPFRSEELLQVIFNALEH